MATISFRKYDSHRLNKIAAMCLPGSCLDLGFAQTPNPFLCAEKTTGVDLNRNKQNIRYQKEIVGDVRCLDQLIPGLSFENVIVGELIEHLEDPYGFLRSLRTFVRPSGQLILSTPNPVGWPTLLMEWIMSRKFFYTDEHKYYFPPRWVARLLSQSGYELRKLKGVGLWMPFLVPPCPAVLSYQVIYAATVKRPPPKPPSRSR